MTHQQRAPLLANEFPIRVLWIGYEISGRMVPVDSQAKVSLKQGRLGTPLIPDQRTIFQATSKAATRHRMSTELNHV